MRLDLVKLNAVEAQFEADILLPHGIIKNLLSICFPKEKKETIRGKRKKPIILIFAEDYILNQKKHFARGMVVKSEDGKKHNIIISYSTFAPLLSIERDKSLKPLSALLDCLSEIKEEIILDVNTHFRYSDEKYKCSILDLPIKLERMTEFFDEIRGVRFTKTQNEKINCSVIMDRPMNKDIFNTVIFQFTGIFSKDLPEKILEYADHISRRLINEK